MEEKTAREQIESLTKKQRQILLRVCDEKTYGEIAQELKRSRNTVKSHMRNIYVKLGLEFVPSEDRRVLLREIYCPLLKEITPQPIVVMESEESEEDDDIEIVEGIIVEDENPILLYSPQPLQSQPRPRQRMFIFALGCGAVLFILLVGAVGLGFVLGNQFEFRGGAQAEVTQAESPTVDVAQMITEEPAPTETEQVVVPPTQPERTEVIPPSTPVVNVTVVQSTPTHVPKPTNTPDLDTPSGSIIQAGEWWMQDDVWLRVKSAQLTEQGGIWIILEMWNQTSIPLSWQWNAGGNLSLTDNTGHIYIPTNQSSNLIGQTILDPGELSEVTLRSFGYSAVYQDPSFFNPSVTELILTVIGFPNIPEAKFRIPA
jgi:hypothetical protein